MASLPEFQQKQYAFAAHIRDPENNPAPSGVEDRRMAIYRELFFNNLHNLIGSTFPVIKKLHKPDKFRSLIRSFMVRHEAQTPYFLEIPREFLAFLENSYEMQDDAFPFLIELAHYEWVELQLSVSVEVNDTTNV
ncbi:MAG: putative DNA-binding domain-containing protein, partial [Proteobacteria bacterium]|nr:putative DNA-binding domain-containing protein [Pseudomonadota bacterium]